MSEEPGQEMKRERIALIGFRGIGKSTLAAPLAARLSMRLISLDSLIELQEGRSIEAIVNENGWDRFRGLEEAALAALAGQTGILVDTGGGVLEGKDKALSEKKMELLQENYFCIYLRMNTDAILRRLEEAGTNATRVSLGGETPRQTLERRAPWYEEASDVIVDIDQLNPDEAVDKIIQNMEKANA